MAATQLGSLAVGSTVKLKVNGAPANFIVVHQGKPDSSLYDSSFDGTWLLSEQKMGESIFHDTINGNYQSAKIQSYMTGTIQPMFDAETLALAKQLKLPYAWGNGVDDLNTLSCKIFLLSANELGWNNTTEDREDIPNDGAKLDYFLSGSNTSANNKRKIPGSDMYNGTYWTRSVQIYRSNQIWAVSGYDGGKLEGSYNSTNGVRPALILPKDLYANDDGSVTANQPPETPASITIPESIQGGASITIRWAAATDPDGNLAGYTLERSTDGGSGWAQVYQGAATSTTDTVAFGTVSVIYRVKAYDAAGAESGWRTSESVTVINNSAPAAPGSITVPELVKGGESLAVSWAAASDPDENLTGYELERKTNAADWAQVYKGDALSYTDQITKGWLSVQYRVRAVDSYNAASGWTESDARTVDNNSAPVIACEHPSGSDLGEKAEPFALSYTVTDPDGDPLTVTETLDDTPTRSEEEVESGTALEAATLNDPAAFQKILNGPHSLKITASDGKASAAHNLTFTKKVTSASVTLKEPMAAEGDIYLAVLRVTGSMPADALLTVEVTNNGNDDNPLWQDATDEVKRGANIVFENHTAAKGAAFNFRLSVSRGPSGEGGYLTSISGAFQ